MSGVPFGNDGDFSDKAMILKCNANLANELGNLSQRTLSMVCKNCGQAVPSVSGEFSEEDKKILSSAQSARKRAAEAMSVQAIHKYVEVLVSLVWEANKYIDTMEPWVLRKTDPERMGTVLYIVMEVLRYAAILYQPVIPKSAGAILDQLSVPNDQRTFAHLNDEFRIRQGAPISKPSAVFPRIDIPAELLVDA